jgi:hypothetical protein
MQRNTAKCFMNELVYQLSQQIFLKEAATNTKFLSHLKIFFKIVSSGNWPSQYILVDFFDDQHVEWNL